MRNLTWSALACALAMYGCGDDDLTPIDTGTRDMAMGLDSSTSDGGSDAAGSDGGSDGATDDAATGTDAAGSDADISVDADITGDATVADGSIGMCDVPLRAPLQVRAIGECPSVRACGGDPEGIWTYEGGCIEADIESVLGMCGDDSEFEFRNSFVAACVEITGSTITRQGRARIRGTASLTGACANELLCAQAPRLLRMAFASATCEVADGACNCEFGDEIDLAITTSPYLVESNTLGTDPGTGMERRFDFCSRSGSLRYQEQGMMGDPGIWDLAPGD